VRQQDLERVFNAWMSNHKGLIYKIVRAYATNPADQEDLFQEIAAQLWFSLPKFKGKSAESTWIYRVSLFCFMSWTKKEKRLRERKSNYQQEQFLKVEPEKENPRLTWLYEQIHELSPLDRSLTLLLLDGYRYKEIADILGLSESNIGVKINRIKKSLTKKTTRMEKNHDGIQ